MKEMFRREYAPAPDIPSWFAARLKAVGGTTLDGRPKLKVVWGMDARGFPWPDNRHVKYINPEDPEIGWACWVLEQHVEPSFFGDPDEWEKARFAWAHGRRVEVMAPYPSAGEYVMVMPLVTPAGEPFELTEQVADFVSALVRERHLRPHNAYTQQALIAERLQKIRDAREERRKAAAEALAVKYDETQTKADRINLGMTRAYSAPAAEPARRSSAVTTIPADLLRRAGARLMERIGAKHDDSTD